MAPVRRFPARAEWQVSGLADLDAHEALLQRLVDEMDARIADLPADRDVLGVSEDLRLLVVVLKELAGLLRALDAAKTHDSDPGKRVRMLMGRLLAEGAKVGIRVIILVQRAEAGVVGAFERARCSLRISFRATSGPASKIAFEAVGGVWKRGREGGRTPFQVLADFLATGHSDDLDIWHEWETGSKGMRQLVWTKGLKGRVGIGEKTDEEIAAATQDAEPVITLPARTWKRTRHDPTGLLDAAEESTQAACAWLEERGLPFEVVEHVVPKGLDAVEFLSRVGPDAFRRLVELTRTTCA